MTTKEIEEKIIAATNEICENESRENVAIAQMNVSFLIFSKRINEINKSKKEVMLRKFYAEAMRNI